MAAKFRRKNIRLRREKYVGQGLYFLTLCFSNRRRVGANPKIASWLIERMRSQAAASGFLVHAYCVMPDHMHLLVKGANTQSNSMKFVEAIKQETGFRFEASTGKRLWQFKYYDHIVRTEEGAERVAWYIWMNPVRKSMYRAPQDHPFSGSFTEIGTARLNKKPPIEQWAPPWKTEK